MFDKLQVTSRSCRWGCMRSSQQQSE